MAQSLTCFKFFRKIMQVLTTEELQTKGISKRNVSGMLRRAEKLCNWYAAKHLATGSVTDKEQTEWNAACARWDHLKATLQGMSSIPPRIGYKSICFGKS
jgi:hypothetical protein